MEVRYSCSFSLSLPSLSSPPFFLLSPSLFLSGIHQRKLLGHGFKPVESVSLPATSLGALLAQNPYLWSTYSSWQVQLAEAGERQKPKSKVSVFRALPEVWTDGSLLTLQAVLCVLGFMA